MRTVLLTTALLLGLSLTACTGDSGQPDGPDAAARPTSAGAGEGSGPAEPSTDGPLQLDDARGEACASLRYGDEYTAWEHVLRPGEDVVLTGIRLVGADRVRAPSRAFVAELPREVGATGFSLGFPPGPKVTGSRNLDWAGRRPAVGARLDAGTSSNLWVRIQVDDGARRAGYEGLELRYTSGAQEYAARSDIRTRFRWRCR